MLNSENEFEYSPEELESLQKAGVRSEIERDILREMIQYLDSEHIYVTDIPPFTENGPVVPGVEFTTYHAYRRKLVLRLTVNDYDGTEWIYSFVHFINDCLSNKKESHPSKVTFQEKFHPIHDYMYGEVVVLIPDNSSTDFFVKLIEGIREGIKQLEVNERACVDSSTLVKTTPVLIGYEEESYKELLEELDRLPGLTPIKIHYSEYKEQSYYLAYVDVSFVANDETGIYTLKKLEGQGGVDLKYTFENLLFKSNDTEHNFYGEAPVWVVRFNLKNVYPDFSRAVNHVKCVIENFNEEENNDYDREDFTQ